MHKKIFFAKCFICRMHFRPTELFYLNILHFCYIGIQEVTNSYLVALMQ